MKRIIFCAVLLIIPLIVSATGFAKENATKSFSIPFMNKTITFGATPEQVASNLRAKRDSPEDNEKKYALVYVSDINGVDSLRLRFRNNKLVSIGIQNNSTEGPGKEIVEFEQWLQKTYGKGKSMKSKDNSTSLTKWNLPGYTIIRDYYYSESGDSFTNFEIIAK